MFIPCWLGGPLLCNKQTKIKSSPTQPHIVVRCTRMYMMFLYVCQGRQPQEVVRCTLYRILRIVPVGLCISAVKYPTQPPRVLERMLSVGLSTLSDLNSIQPTNHQPPFGPDVTRACRTKPISLEISEMYYDIALRIHLQLSTSSSYKYDIERRRKHILFNI